MTPARIIKSFQVFKHRKLGLRLRAEAAPIEQLALESGKEAFGHGIVVGITDGANRGYNAHFLAALAEREARVLAAAVRVMDHALGPPLGERHVDGSEHQLG